MSTISSRALGFPRGTTVLLVINPVNDFLSDAGAGWELTKGVVQSHRVLEKLQTVIAGARENGVRVVFGAMAFTEEDYTTAGLQQRSVLNRLLFERRVGLAGTWGAEFHPSLRPFEGETVLTPGKGVDFMATNLPDCLGRLGASHLAICGVPALACVYTGARAVDAGYDVIFLSDAIAAESSAAYDAAVSAHFPMVGNGVMKVDDFLHAIGDDNNGFDQIARSDRLFGSDGAEIGRIDDLVMPAEGVEPYLQVGGGLLAKTVYVPLDAVVRRMGPHVFINVPKSMVGHLGWEAAPTRSGQSAKLGPAAADVKMPFRSHGPTGPTMI